MTAEKKPRSVLGRGSAISKPFSERMMLLTHKATLWHFDHDLPGTVAETRTSNQPSLFFDKTELTVSSEWSGDSPIQVSCMDPAGRSHSGAS